MYIFSKWWYILPIDAPESDMYGFPLPFQCDGWHTSMSIQIFLLEFFIDYIFYIAFFSLIFIITKRYLAFRISPKITYFLSWILYLISTFNLIFCFIIFETKFYPKRYFEINVIETKFSYVGKYHFVDYKVSHIFDKSKSF